MAAKQQEPSNMKYADILIVEDDAALRDALCDTLELEDYDVVSARNGIDALSKMTECGFRIVISDVQMDQMDGLTLLENIKSSHPGTPVLLITAYGTIQKAVDAIRAGAVDYLVKPFEPAALLTQVNRYISEPMARDHGAVAEDPKTKHLLDLAMRVAQSDATVMIQGDSGTGKEVLARYIHRNSTRNGGPFVALNCAAIPANMLEAVLFGYEKGAFTGAHQATPGKFELAQGGTLLLDEISEMELGLQAKLLRVLQEREVERIGARKSIDLDVRVLATTNRHLRDEVMQGNFREDLYYRLNVIPLRIPALKDRPLDIFPLAKRLLEKHWHSGKPLPHFDGKAEQLLMHYPWPGNVRELENVIQRALIMRTGEAITSMDLAFETHLDLSDENLAAGTSTFAKNLDSGLRSAEEKIILDVLNEEGGSRKSTAERLGISPRTLRYKLARIRESGVAASV